MDTPAVYAAIANVSAELAKVGIGKTRKNQQQGYAFRGIDEVLNTLAPLLASHGLVVIPRIVSREMTERETRQGGALFNVVVCGEFDFVGVADGSKHTVQTYGEAMDSADKATNKAMSAAYKYAAFLTFCIPVEGMAADGDTTTPPEVVPRGTRAVPDNVNPETGEERPPAPEGYHYVADYTLRNGWHEAKLLRYDAQGGALLVSTKKPFGALLNEAERAGKPVKVTTGKKSGSVGEAYANAVTVWKEPAHDDGPDMHTDQPPPLTDADIPF